MSRLVQLYEVKGEVRRVKPGEKPVVELHLEDNRRVVSLEIHETPWSSYSHERKTKDYIYTAIIEADCS